MKYLFLILSGFRRRPVRTILTLFSAIAAFVLFGTLRSIDVSIRHLVDIAHIDRLITGEPATRPMPMAYQGQIERIAGVKAVTHVNANVGTYRQAANRVFVYAIEAARYFSIYPETVTSAVDRLAMERNRAGAIVSTNLARRFGWKRGDRIALREPTVPQRNGSVDWQFEIVGFCDYASSPTTPIALINFAYLDAARLSDRGTAQRFVSLIQDPSQSGGVSERIDSLFANAPAATRTETEKDFAQAQLSQLGDIDFFVDAIVSAVFFTLLLVLANALMQSFRERRREFAILKTLGFSEARIGALLVAEFLAFSLLAAITGLGLSQILVLVVGRASGGLVPAQVTPSVLLTGLAAAAAVGLVSAAVPAWQIRKLIIIDALALD